MRVLPTAPACLFWLLGLLSLPAALEPAAQQFKQELAMAIPLPEGIAAGTVQLIDQLPQGSVHLFAGGRWLEWRERSLRVRAEWTSPSDQQFVVPDVTGQARTVSVPWREVRQIVRQDNRLWLATEADPFEVRDGQARTLGWPSRFRVNQIAVSPEGEVWVASNAGLFQRGRDGWKPASPSDGLGRSWGTRDVLGIAFDAKGGLWFATKAGVARQTTDGWRFYEGKDGLPWADFTWASAGADGELWFGTHLGAIRFDGREWHYRQGRRWLPHDDVRQIMTDASGSVWLATAGGVGTIQRQPMTLAQKAAIYEEEIERYIKRTPFGYVAEAPLRVAADKSSAQPHDSDNDGLWTAMYGAGECFAYAATRDPKAKVRAQQAFEALRFLQKVTQGGEHAPPKGYIARTVRSTADPDPNVGRLESDRQEQKRDKLWKVYEPRWPKSADGKWYWKSDTSSDELDGHYFFYPLCYDFCAETDAEKDRVREVVRDITDHLLTHGFNLVDHDGKPTRWGIFSPDYLNKNPQWWPERGLNSLSILSYLAVAAHVTGDPKYDAASRRLIDEHDYAHNIMYAKVQNGPGSGNQSDDEMAFMDYYSLLRCSTDESLKRMARFSFFRYWVNEAPEMNPFFNFAYAAQSLEAQSNDPFGTFRLGPWEGWLEDSIASLRGFPLDRLNWAQQNHHRLDLQPLNRQGRVNLQREGRSQRGSRVNGKVLPVENRHFNHWNTDPWTLDYHGQGGELAAGTVFLLPYYLGLYHGYIQKP
jgi:hypothetical protein